MPELPEIEAYLAALEPRIVDRTVTGVLVKSVSLLRTFDPIIDDVVGRRVTGVSRMGKRIVLHLDGDRHLVIHLRVAGRLRWAAPAARIPGKMGLAALYFEHGTLLVTEAGSKRRASWHLVVGAEALAALDPGGVEVDRIDAAAFTRRLRAERHTLKRTLTDPKVFAGIGGAFADEILFAARLSPTQMTTNLDDEQAARLHRAAIDVLAHWTALRIAETGDGFPSKVTAFHPDMAVHGRFGEPCRTCGAPIQRIVHGGRETNYCPGCQTGGRILADRALSRLLKDDWPRTIDP